VNLLIRVWNWIKTPWGLLVSADPVLSGILYIIVTLFPALFPVQKSDKEPVTPTIPPLEASSFHVPLNPDVTTLLAILGNQPNLVEIFKEAVDKYMEIRFKDPKDRSAQQFCTRMDLVGRFGEKDPVQFNFFDQVGAASHSFGYQGKQAPLPQCEGSYQWRQVVYSFSKWTEPDSIQV
jgi:hypothetical protein